jgi:hypothetical protein
VVQVNVKAEMIARALLDAKLLTEKLLDGERIKPDQLKFLHYDLKRALEIADAPEPHRG